MVNIPSYVFTVVKRLESIGFQAYLAGGCVRDSIMNIAPNDYDITTNARPEEIKNVFRDFKLILTGEKHGTVAVITNGGIIEITSYRLEKGYTDGRHPDNVEFTSSLIEDLRRRDFTVNAMVYGIHDGLIDPFNGRDDIKNKIIRTVGAPEKRFEEDALRILRGLRFSSRLGFSIESGTAEAVHNLRLLLKNISAERIRDEFVQIIRGQNAGEVLKSYRDVISVFIPEVIPCFDFEQHSPYHKYDVWEHTVNAVSECIDKENVKLAMFFHDIAKPECFTVDFSGRGHFKGHAQKSALKAEAVMKRMRFPKSVILNVKAIIYHHSDELNTEFELKKILNQIGVRNAFDLIDAQRADSLSKQDFCRERLKKSDMQEQSLRDILKRGECFSIKMLDINGYDLIELGFKGIEIKNALSLLLDNVMRGIVENSRDSLMHRAKSIKNVL